MDDATSILSPDKISLGARFDTKEAAIIAAGELLVAAGHVSVDYIEAMLAREQIATTYIGNGVAIPHGTREALVFVKSAGISVLQTPNGIDFGDGNMVRLVIGIAATGKNHMNILTSIAIVCSDDASLEKLINADKKEEIMALLESELPQ
ncbi:MAG TPA: PTS sugar transporter subunit IIA [Chthoniobacterales bacterium]